MSELVPGDSKDDDNQPAKAEEELRHEKVRKAASSINDTAKKMAPVEGDIKKYSTSDGTYMFCRRPADEYSSYSVLISFESDIKEKHYTTLTVMIRPTGDALFNMITESTNEEGNRELLSAGVASANIGDPALIDESTRFVENAARESRSGIDWGAI